MLLIDLQQLKKATISQPASMAFVDSAFESVWLRNDQPVASQAAARSWTWGPAPLAAGMEPYAEAPDGSGMRLVQYFDKFVLSSSGVAAETNHDVKSKLGFTDTKQFSQSLLDAVSHVSSTSIGDDCGEGFQAPSDWARAFAGMRHLGPRPAR